MIWGVAAAVGISALLAASELAYRVLTLAGAAYMVWLGVSLLWMSRGKAGTLGRPTEAAVAAAANGQLLRGWATGAGTNLLNPKVGVFYIATIPQFIPAGTSPLLTGVVLAGVHCLLTMAWFTLLIFGSQFASKWLKGPRSIKVVDRITGTVLVGFGLKLAATPGH